MVAEDTRRQEAAVGGEGLGEVELEERMVKKTKKVVADPVFVLVALIAFALGCSSDQLQMLRSPEHIVLISLDTLRRDYVGAYRLEERSFTPTLDQFAQESVTFDRAYAPIPFTLPSHMSIFTSLYPDVHQIEKPEDRLSESVRTLPSELKNRGFRTTGIVSGIWMEGQFGFSRGFDHYERLDGGLRPSVRVIDRCFELLEETNATEKSFLFLHFMDPHSDWYGYGQNALPYYSPAEYRVGPEFRADPMVYCDDEGNCATDFLIAADERDRFLDSEMLGSIKTLYRAGIEYLDDDLARLFEGLRARGYWDDALVIVTSDHGEEFREHGRFIHCQPYSENLAVPLIIKFPRSELGGTRCDSLVENMDLMPTILDLVGEDVESSGQGLSQGVSLIPRVQGQDDQRDTVLGRDKVNRKRYGLYKRDFAYIHDYGAKKGELYDLRSDPTQEIDISASHPWRCRMMRLELWMKRAANRRAAARLGSEITVGESVLSDEEREKLRALGYVD